MYFISRGFESETDTEEFEKVGQSPIDFQNKNSAMGSSNLADSKSRQDASTITEVGRGTKTFPSSSQLPPKKPPRSFSTSLSNKKQAICRQDESMLNKSLRFDINIPSSSTSFREDELTESAMNQLNENSNPIPDHSPSQSLGGGHQQMPSEFVTTEYYIDESMPSSLSTDGGGSIMLPPAELMRQLDDSNNVVALLQVHFLLSLFATTT